MTGIEAEVVEIETAARWSLVAKDALLGAFSDDDDSVIVVWPNNLCVNGVLVRAGLG